MDYKKYKGAIFDCDGTLLESMGMWYHNASRIVRHFGFEPTADLDEICIKLSMKDACEYINNLYHMENDYKELTDLAYKLSEDEYFHKLELKPYAKDFLDKLKKLDYKMIVATATPTYLVKECFKRLGVLDYFVDVISVRDYNTSKNEPKIYEIAASKLNLEKEECIVFEDAKYAIDTCLKNNFNVVVVKDKSQDESINDVLSKALDFIEL